MGCYSADPACLSHKIRAVVNMKQITPAEFLAKAESGDIIDIFSIQRRVYGKDKSYDFTRAEAGKIYEIVYADVP